jgi:predicted ATPase
MRRSQIHRRIGAAGEAIYRDRVEEIAAELAMHFEQGHDPPRAVKYLLQAAETARHRSAHREAETLARRGLQAAASLPPSPERDQQELALRLILGVAVMAIKGFAASEVKDIFTPALELSVRGEASSQTFMVQWLLGLFHYFRAEMQPSREIAERLLNRAGATRDPLMVIEAHRASGVTLLELGRCHDALKHFDTVTALYDPDRHRAHVPFGGQDPQVVSDCFAGRALWMLGYPDRALKQVDRGVALAERLGHVESHILATHFAAHLHQLRGEAALSQERAETVIAVAEEYGLAVWIAFGHLNRGWARVEQGDTTAGLEELEHGLSAYESTGGQLWKPYFLGLLAQALAKGGQLLRARSEIARALESSAETGEFWAAAELHRIEGNLVLAEGRGGDPATPASSSELSTTSRRLVSKAESSFRQSLAIARRQASRSWELKTLTSLSRFKLGPDSNAAHQLAAAYAWFSEGHETATLREATAAMNSGV